MPDREITPVREITGARPSTQFEPGDVLCGQYCIEEKLGDGGMGSVYRCRDLVLGRSVALKFLHPHLLAMNKWLMRFQQEAKAIGRLEHVNIIKVHHFAADDDCPFLVMDYVQGESLADVIKKAGSLPSSRALKIMMQVADALAHAHKNNVVHRDLKPSNIVVLENDVVKILDFGIAKIEEMQSAPNLTETGEIFGSPAYMSPEQCIGKHVDARTDQYSLGCVLYECLTGSPPFVSDSSIEVMMHHISNTPQSLKESSLGKHFSSDLELTMQKLLAKNPSERFDSMSSVHDALTNLMLGRANLRPVNDTQKLVEKPRFTSGELWSGAVISVVLLASLVALLYQLMPTPSVPSKKIEVSPWIKKLTVVDMANEKFAAGVVRYKREHPGVITSFGPSAELEIDDRAMEVIAANFPHLTVLDLKDCTNVKAPGIRALSKLPLKEFYFANSDPNDDTVRAIASIKTLEVVAIPGSTSYTDKGVEALTKLPALRHLNLGNNSNLTDRSLVYIARCAHLKSLDLTMVPVREFRILTKSGIEQISANGTLIDDANMIALSKMKSLHLLSLTNTRLTDTSIPAVCSMKGQLKSLQMKGCLNLSDASYINLHKVFGKRLTEWR